jgi:sugar fermentation stimulation protein A
MQFPQPLVRGTLVKRYKRFLADVVLESGEELTAHCPNPGAMLGLNMPGLPVWLSKSADPKRKLSHTLELVDVDGGLVGINTMHPNRLVAEALKAGTIAEAVGYDRIRPEVKYGANSRVDFLLEKDNAPPLWLEVKNVHLMRTPGLAEFPDCVAARSLKHLKEMTERVRMGERALMVYVIQRMDCHRFTPCMELDPAYAKGLAQALQDGVEAAAYACHITPQEIVITEPVKIEI